MTKPYPNQIRYAIMLGKQPEFKTEYSMVGPVKVACIGEVMIELIAEHNGNASIAVAGDTYNTAVYLTKLAKSDALGVSYITALGTATFSKRILSQKERYGIDASYIEWRENQMPGLYAIETDDQGERSFSYWRGQSAAKTLFQQPCRVGLEAISTFDLVYISGISMAILPPDTRSALIQYLGEYRKSGGKLAFDSNYRPRLWENSKTARDVTMAMWSMTDIALPSLDDEMALFGDLDEKSVLRRLSDAGISFGALKRGIDGPAPIGSTSHTMLYEKIANCVDTTAAGDSFNAGFLFGYLSGYDLDEAMAKGHALASKVIQTKGAIIDFD